MISLPPSPPRPLLVPHPPRAMSDLPSLATPPSSPLPPPHRLKLQLPSDNSGVPPQPPAWVSELLASGCLIGCPKFSKFVHGTATLYQGQKPIDGNVPVRELPY